MKKAAGLFVAVGCFGFACHAMGEPSSRSAGSESGAKASELRSAALDELESQAPRSLFAAADRDGDGSVTYGELTSVVHASIARRIQARFRQLDRNRDGRCTRGEVNKMKAARFARFDLNGDGVFTLRELAKVMTAQVAQRLARIYTRLDMDHDGRFTVAELTIQPKPRSVEPAAVVARTKSDPGRKTSAVARRGSAAVH